MSKFSYYSSSRDGYQNESSSYSSNSDENEGSFATDGWTMVKERKAKRERGEKKEKKERNEVIVPVSTHNSYLNTNTNKITILYRPNDRIHFILSINDDEIIDSSGIIISPYLDSDKETEVFYHVELDAWMKLPLPVGNPNRYVSKDTNLSFKNRHPTDFTMTKYLLISQDEIVEGLSLSKFKKPLPEVTLGEILSTMWNKLVFRRVSKVKTDKGEIVSIIHPEFDPYSRDIVFVTDDEITSKQKEGTQVRWSYFYGFTGTSSVTGVNGNGLGSGNAIASADKWRGQPIFFDSRNFCPFAMPEKFTFASYVDTTETGLLVPNNNSLICGLVEIGDKGKPCYTKWWKCSTQFYNLWTMICESRNAYSLSRDLMTGKHLSVLKNDFDLEMTVGHGAIDAPEYDESRMKCIISTDFNVEPCAIITTDFYKKIGACCNKFLRDIVKMEEFKGLRWLLPSTNENKDKNKEETKPVPWLEKSKVKTEVSFAKVTAENINPTVSSLLAAKTKKLKDEVVIVVVDVESGKADKEAGLEIVDI